jgi:hypothetical protein
MNIKDKAKELCEKSRCHHKCNDTKDCVVEDEAREYLPSTLKNEEKISETEKQIEEMAKTILDFVHTKHNQFSMQDLAEHLYNTGYRKQSEGKNVAIYPSSAFECSECHWEDWDLYTADSAYNFCPNCGAKMKGGE